MKKSTHFSFIIVMVLFAYLCVNCSGQKKDSNEEAEADKDMSHVEVSSSKSPASVLTLDTYYSFSEIVFANPRATLSLYSGSNTSSISLDRVSSRLGTKFNVYIEKGLEEKWEKLKNAYNLNPPEGWVSYILTDEITEYIAIARNADNSNVLFLTRAHGDFYGMFLQDWATFVQDPKGILERK